MMGLWAMDTGRADFFPQIGNRVEADKGRSALHVHEQDVEYFKQYFGILIVQINLVVTERRPHMLFA